MYKPKNYSKVSTFNFQHENEVYRTKLKCSHSQHNYCNKFSILIQQSELSTFSYQQNKPLNYNNHSKVERIRDPEKKQNLRDFNNYPSNKKTNTYWTRCLYKTPSVINNQSNCVLRRNQHLHTYFQSAIKRKALIEPNLQTFITKNKEIFFKKK